MFSAICNDNAVEFEVLDQIAELEEILTLNMISAKHETLFDVSALKQERNTWRLIGRLYHDELMQAQNTNDSIANMKNSTVEREIIEHAFTADRKFRRAQVIVDWLEYNARKGN